MEIALGTSDREGVAQPPHRAFGISNKVRVVDGDIVQSCLLYHAQHTPNLYEIGPDSFTESLGCTTTVPT